MGEIEMFNLYDNPPEDYIPCNRPRFRKKEMLTIMAGETATHSFDVPIDVDEECSSVEVIYKLGLNVILIKVPNASEVLTDECGKFWISNVTVVLSDEYTLKFKSTYLNASAQLKFHMKVDGSVQYSEICPIRIRNSLDANALQ